MTNDDIDLMVKEIAWKAIFDVNKENISLYDLDKEKYRKIVRGFFVLTEEEKKEVARIWIEESKDKDNEMDKLEGHVKELRDQIIEQKNRIVKYSQLMVKEREELEKENKKLKERIKYQSGIIKDLNTELSQEKRIEKLEIKNQQLGRHIELLNKKMNEFVEKRFVSLKQITSLIKSDE